LTGKFCPGKIYRDVFIGSARPELRIFQVRGFGRFCFAEKSIEIPFVDIGRNIRSVVFKPREVINRNPEKLRQRD